MSPSESELRAFLRGGEGETPDADALIAHARAVRHNRRVRLASVAGAVIVVGAVSAGAVALGQDDGHPTAGSPPPATAQHQPTNGDTHEAPSRPAPSHIASTAVPSHVGPSTGRTGPNATCPAIPPHLMLPGGGGTGQFGGDGPLFDGTITSMQICGYAARGTGGAVQFSRATLVTGSRAGEIATSLNAASTKQLMPPCQPPMRTSALVIYAKTASGVASKPVVVDYSCGGSATNGTAVRYDWTPPPAVATALDALTTPVPALPNATGSTPITMSGSPVR
jgi:hypothetical protein